MSDVRLDRILETYLRQVRAALSALPQEVRDDVLAELRSHLLDRLEAGVKPEAVLHAFGPPEAHARALFDAHQLAGALTTRRVGALMSVIGLRIAHDAATALVGLLVLIVWGTALALAGVALMKIADPTHTGLWTSPTQFFVGVIDDPEGAREILGIWIFPLALVAVLASWMVTRWLTVWALTRIARGA